MPIIDFAPAVDDPAREDYAQDVGFDYFGFASRPRRAGGGLGRRDDGRSTAKISSIDEGFYYRTCPDASCQIDFRGPLHPTRCRLTTTPVTRLRRFDPDPGTSTPRRVRARPTTTGVDRRVTNVAAPATVTSRSAQSGVVRVARRRATSRDALAAGNYTVEIVQGRHDSPLSPYRCGVPYTLHVLPVLRTTTARLRPTVPSTSRSGGTR